MRRQARQVQGGGRERPVRDRGPRGRRRSEGARALGLTGGSTLELKGGWDRAGTESYSGGAVGGLGLSRPTRGSGVTRAGSAGRRQHGRRRPMAGPWSGDESAQSAFEPHCAASFEPAQSALEPHCAASLDRIHCERRRRQQLSKRRHHQPERARTPRENVVGVESPRASAWNPEPSGARASTAGLTSSRQSRETTGLILRLLVGPWGQRFRRPRS